MAAAEERHCDPAVCANAECPAESASFIRLRIATNCRNAGQIFRTRTFADQKNLARHSLWIPVHPLAQNCLLSIGFFRDLVGPHLEAQTTVLCSRKKHLQAHIGRNLGRPFLNKHAARGTRITSDRAEGSL